MKLPKLLEEDRNNPEIRAIKAVIKANKDLSLHERYQTILLDLHGVSKNDISKIIGRSLATIYDYIKAYRQKGILELRIGTAPRRQPFLTVEQEQSVLTLLYLPPYSPKLNLIEGLWGWLKESVIHNVFFDTVQKICKAVQGFIHEINKTLEVTVDRLCVQL